MSFLYLSTERSNRKIVAGFSFEKRKSVVEPRVSRFGLGCNFRENPTKRLIVNVYLNFSMTTCLGSIFIRYNDRRKGQDVSAIFHPMCVTWIFHSHIHTCILVLVTAPADNYDHHRLYWHISDHYEIFSISSVHNDLYL